MTDDILKPGWTRVRFGDIVRQVKDKVDPETSGLKRYIAGEHMNTDDLRIRSWGEIGDGYLGPAFHMRFKPGQVLYGSRRTYLRKVAVPDFEGICANTTFVLESKDPSTFLPELLPFIMQTEAFHEYSITNSKGSVNPYINFSDLAQYEFALPPLAEQRRIAGVLGQIEALLEEFATLSKKTEMVKNALIEAMISSFVSNTQVELGTLADVRYGLTVNKTRRNAPKRIPYLRVANLMRGYLDLSEVKDIGQINGDEVYELQYGDVLVVEGHADSMEIGRAAIWKRELDRCAHQNHLIRARCGEALDPEFLTIYLNSTFGRSHFTKHAKSTSGLNTINSSVVQKTPIPVIELDCQQHIVTVVGSIRSQHEATNTRFEELRSMKQLLLLELDYDV